MTASDEFESRLAAYAARCPVAPVSRPVPCPAARRAVPDRGDRRTVVVVSLLLHGEAATAESCQRLAALHPSPEARRCLARQAADEARHAAAYASYLGALGDIAPAPATLLASVRGAAGWPGPPWVGPLLANLVLESEAVRLQRHDLANLGGSMLATMHRELAKDEARHVALGRLLLRDAARGLDEAAKVALGARARELWWTCAEAALDRRLGPFGRGALAPRWRRMERDLATAGFGPTRC